ncbi:ANTAR domain-containing protein [Nocardioides sp. W7]|uniref:ANTAR domain-containing protein n=1 Tax=Nocardioides sp. W7 TaxID=2931390 RepID=UPI001FD1DBCF|nr:ANTAR domain-containing protein [Nocardioides sp. W7]
MEPIRETVEAANELDPSLDAVEPLDHLARLASRAKGVVPSLVGLSVARLDQGVTFTLVASDEEVAVLDAVQYVAGGPCVAGAYDEQVHEFDNDDVLDEERWHLFAAATAAHGVRTTLTLPVVGLDPGDGRVVGTVNLYAASPRAFVGLHDELAGIFGAWATGAMTNVDLPFTTRSEAQAAPRLVREQSIVEVAKGILAAQLGLDVDTAEARLREAAARAGVSAVELAREIIRAREGRDPGES